MWRRVVLSAFLASIAVNTILGIWALLAGDFGDTQAKILVTSFCVSAAMLGALVNAFPLGRRVMWPLPVVATASFAAGFAELVLIVWAEPDGSAWAKSVTTLLIIGAGATLVGLIGLLPLRRLDRLARFLHTVVTAALVTTLIAMMWTEVDAAWLGRLIGVESVLVAALTLAVPTLARYRPTEPPPSRPGSRPGRASDRGPHPGLTDTPPDDIVCSRCGAHLDRFGRERSDPPVSAAR